MRSSLLMVAFLAASTWDAACTPHSHAGRDSTNQSANPPARAVATELPTELAQALPHTDAGLPILMASDPDRPSRSISLAYDSRKDNSMVRWGECLSRVLACLDTNSGPIAGCVELVSVCPSNDGGMRCCPQSCIAQFKSHLERGWSEERAIEESFLKGDCVGGFTAFRDAAMAGVQP